MSKGKTPCYECKDRAIGCHGTCLKYKVFRKDYEKIRLNKKFGRMVKGEKDGNTKENFGGGSAYILRKW